MKLTLQIVGIIVGAIGCMCIPLGISPIGYHVSPKRGLSGFNNLADTGMFAKAGFVLLGAGGVILGISWLLPDDNRQ